MQRIETQEALASWVATTEDIHTHMHTHTYTPLKKNKNLNYSNSREGRK